ncbi:MAG TPA: acylphosphatase [Propionibacteriaceae bacterium]|nr:acylphosphatase [Propionibacteriaceae bacterium]
MTATRAVRVVVRGSVQAVGFRWTCAERARGLGVSGWVKNLADGTVEAWFEGAPDAVDAMIAWCRVGPRWADVTGVTVAEWAPEGRVGFSIR